MKFLFSNGILWSPNSFSWPGQIASPSLFDLIVSRQNILIFISNALIWLKSLPLFSFSHANLHISFSPSVCPEFGASCLRIYRKPSLSSVLASLFAILYFREPHHLQNAVAFLTILLTCPYHHQVMENERKVLLYLL